MEKPRYRIKENKSKYRYIERKYDATDSKDRHRHLSSDEIERIIAAQPIKDELVLWLTEQCDKNVKLQKAIEALVTSVMSTCRCDPELRNSRETDQVVTRVFALDSAWRVVVGVGYPPNVVERYWDFDHQPSDVDISTCVTQMLAARAALQ